MKRPRRQEPVAKRCVRAVRRGKVLTAGGIWRALPAESEQEPTEKTEGPNMASKSVYNLAGAQKIASLQEEFDKRVAAAVEDCRQRPGIKKAREVTLTVKLTPHPQDADDVFVDHEVKAKLPIKRIDTYRMQATNNNGLKFQPNSPEQPDQEGFDFGEDS